jgi:hypothetical protein
MFCPNAVEWDGVGTWVASIGTVSTLFFAVYQWSKAVAEKRLANEDARRAQARRVCTWLDAHSGHGGLRLSNSSDEPVTSVIVYYVWAQGAAWRTGEEAERRFQSSREPDGYGDINTIRALVQNLPPGRFWVTVDGPENAPMQGQLGLEIAFTDSAGQSWVRRAGGELVALDQSPIVHYGVALPARYQRLLDWD